MCDRRYTDITIASMHGIATYATPQGDVIESVFRPDFLWLCDGFTAVMCGRTAAQQRHLWGVLLSIMGRQPGVDVELVEALACALDEAAAQQPGA